MVGAASNDPLCARELSAFFNYLLGVRGRPKHPHVARRFSNDVAERHCRHAVGWASDVTIAEPEVRGGAMPRRITASAGLGFDPECDIREKHRRSKRYAVYLTVPRGTSVILILLRAISFSKFRGHIFEWHHFGGLASTSKSAPQPGSRTREQNRPTPGRARRLGGRRNAACR